MQVSNLAKKQGHQQPQACGKPASHQSREQCSSAAMQPSEHAARMQGSHEPKKKHGSRQASKSVSEIVSE